MQQLNKFFAVDEVSEGVATLENQATCELISVPQSDLPEGAKEGSIVFCDTAGSWQLDLQETQSRAEKISELQAELFK